MRRVPPSALPPQHRSPLRRRRRAAAPGDRLEATCDYNSTERSEITTAGSTHHHEMCNLYMMMWSELPVFMTCGGGGPHGDTPSVNPAGAGARGRGGREAGWGGDTAARCRVALSAQALLVSVCCTPPARPFAGAVCNGRPERLVMMLQTSKARC